MPAHVACPDRLDGPAVHVLHCSKVPPNWQPNLPRPATLPPKHMAPISLEVAPRQLPRLHQAAAHVQVLHAKRLLARGRLAARGREQGVPACLATGLCICVYDTSASYTAETAAGDLGAYLSTCLPHRLLCRNHSPAHPPHRLPATLPLHLQMTPPHLCLSTMASAAAASWLPAYSSAKSTPVCFSASGEVTSSILQQTGGGRFPRGVETEVVRQGRWSA